MHVCRLVYEVGREVGGQLRRRDDAATLGRVLIKSTGREAGRVVGSGLGGWKQLGWLEAGGVVEGFSGPK